MRLNILTIAIIAAIGLGSIAAFAAEAPKDASEATEAANAALLKALPFADKQSFEDAHRGFIAPLSDEVVKTQDGRPVWNPKQYGFIEEGSDAPGTVNPSLWRQSQLINISGLFQVADRIYQIRNQDLSNMSIVEGARASSSSIRWSRRRLPRRPSISITSTVPRSRWWRSSTPTAMWTTTAACAA